MPEIRIGISGWRYAPWRGKFYPDDAPFLSLTDQNSEWGEQQHANENQFFLLVHQHMRKHHRQTERHQHRQCYFCYG